MPQQMTGRGTGPRKIPTQVNLPTCLLTSGCSTMSSDTGGWTRPVSWFSPASDVIARGTGSSTSARASHRRRQRSRGAEAAAHIKSQRRGSIGDTGTSNNMDSEEDSELDDSSAAGRRQRNRRQQQRPTPTLTVILMRLEASMAQYCSELSTPTAPNARKAARVLDIDTLGDAVDPLLEAEWARMVDPLTLLAGAEGWYGGLEHLQAQQQPQQKKASSPSASASTNEQAGSRRQRSRIKRGTMGATDVSSQPMNSDSTSAVREVEPALFNGTDTPATSSSHDGDSIMPSSSSSSLSPEAERIRSIYCKVMKDILILKEILCDPIMAASKSENENEPSSSVQQHRQAAESLSKTLATLVELCSVRRSMIVIHSDIAALGSKLTHTCTTKDETTCNAPASSGGMAVASALHSSLLDLAHRCDEVCKTLPEDASTSTSTSTTSSATAPMVKSMRHEIAATRSALRVCAHLENLR